jgi:phosphoenolpyruvate---glycerone phosphotransferase subunit DhaK
MRQFVNSIDILLAESLDGFATAHADIIVLGRGRKQERFSPAFPG